uniref:Cytochrome P450 n=1 Tax=Marmota marmota marmota TaxID=9994 RepID=A0A8C6A388_MARMA
MALPVALLSFFLLLLLMGLVLWSRARDTGSGLPPAHPPPRAGQPPAAAGGTPPPGSVTVLSLQLKDQYGPVFTVRLGPTPLVVLRAAQTVREALVDQADPVGYLTSLCLPSLSVRIFYLLPAGIAFSQGERWRTLRRFALTTLRDLGLGRRSLEERIQEEVGCLERELESTCGTPFDPTFPIRRSTANIICSVVFGCCFHYQDEDFKTFLGLLTENLKQMDTFWVQAYGLFPALLRHLPGPHNRLFEVFEKQKEFMARVVKEHQDSVDTAQPQVFIDAFLIRMQQQGDPHTEFNQENLLNSALDIFFGLLILLKFPQVTDTEPRRPCLGDRPRMPYTDTVLHEIQRFADIMPLGVPHAVTQDTEFQGYHIPKGTTVFPLLHSVLHDPDQFQDPSYFQPERLLDAGGAFRRSPAFLPFSAGQRRACPGEALARAELFLYQRWLLPRFSPTSPLPSAALHLQPRDSGFGKQPPAFQLILQPLEHFRPKDSPHPDSPPPVA